LKKVDENFSRFSEKNQNDLEKSYSEIFADFIVKIRLFFQKFLKGVGNFFQKVPHVIKI